MNVQHELLYDAAKNIAGRHMGGRRNIAACAQAETLIVPPVVLPLEVDAAVGAAVVPSPSWW